MHKFLRAVGLSMYQKKHDIGALLDKLAKEQIYRKVLEMEEDVRFCELRAELAPGMGIAMCGELDKRGRFRREYYYPYLISSDESSQAECSIQRHTEKDTYAGLLDEYRVGISLIFYILNPMDYRERVLDKKKEEIESVSLTGLAISGKILLPIQKSERQRARARVEAKDRNNLIEAAKNGDEDAMETLTIEDIDMYSQISRRMMKEDIYTIIDSFFMPCGIECDQYSLIGEITGIDMQLNRLTQEEVYDLTLDCNDMTIHVGIAKQDLTGKPEIGRRFKGQIWMQGRVKFLQDSKSTLE